MTVTSHLPRLFAATRRLRDLIEDVLIEITARRGRAVLMIAGVALSTGALVAALGISRTASRQIAADMAASTLDEVTVAVAATARDQSGADGSDATPSDTGGAPRTVLPDDAEHRATSIDLVRAAGVALDLSAGSDMEVGRLPATAAPTDPTISLIAITSGYLDAVAAQGAGSTRWMLDGAEPVAVVGVGAAERLGLPVTADPTGLEVWVEDRPVPVVGFVDGADQVRGGVLIPYRVGLARVGNDDHATLFVRTEPGAGSPVARMIRTAVRPDRPELLSTSQVATLGSVRQGVSTQLGRLIATIGGFLLALTVLLIANAMIVSVVARTSEIGLRRALGASRAGVSAVFWTEGALVGFLGGTGGAALASLAVVAVSAVNHWTSSLEVPTVLLTPVLGAVVGLVASAQPALRAGRISPAIAVRVD